MKKSNKPLILFPTSPVFRVASAIFFQIVFFLVLLFNSFFYRLKVIGRNNLHLEEAFLVSNHSLYLDPGVISQAIYPRRTHFTAEEATFHVPILGGMVRLLGAFPLPEQNPMKRLIKPMKQALDTLGFVHFFPEGKLYPLNTSINRFMEGAFFFSFYYNIPVVPLTIIARRKTGIFPPKVRIVIGKPVYPKQFKESGSIRRGMTAMAEEVRRKMQGTIDSFNRHL